jgi:hypothetical protein
MVPAAVIGDAPITINYTGDIVAAAKTLSPVLMTSATRPANGYDVKVVEAMVRPSR